MRPPDRRSPESAVELSSRSCQLPAPVNQDLDSPMHTTPVELSDKEVGSEITMPTGQ